MICEPFIATWPELSIEIEACAFRLRLSPPSMVTLPPGPVVMLTMPASPHWMVSCPEAAWLSGGAGLQESVTVPAVWSMARQRLPSFVPSVMSDAVGGPPESAGGS